MPDATDGPAVVHGSQPAPRASASPPGPRRRGRPRSTTIDTAILEATLERLAIDGYQSLTLSAVAAQAGVGRPTLYRRYAGKAQLVTAALRHSTSLEEAALPSGTPEALRSLLASTAAALEAPGALTVLGSLLAEERRDPALVDTFREAVFEPRHRIVKGILARGVAAGEVRSDVDARIVIDVLFGAQLSRALIGAPITVDWLDSIVRAVWLAISTPGAGLRVSPRRPPRRPPDPGAPAA